MSGPSGRSSSLNGVGDHAHDRAHGPTRRGLRLILFGGLIIGALALASCQPHGAVLQGRITDTDAGRFAGIQVRVYSSTTESLVATTQTDRDGDYSFLPAELADGTYRILFSEDSWWQGATSWADATDVTVTAGSTRTIDATIDAAKGTVTGRVTDGTDPLADVHVTARTMELDQPVAATTTADDGTYAFDALPVGMYRFQFARHGYTTRYSAGATTRVAAPIITVTDGSTIAGVDTTLTGEASISGILSDGSAPVAGGYVFIADPQNDGRVSFAVTSADGRFTFGGLNAGTYAIAFVDGTTGAVTYYGTTGDDPAQATPITLPAGGAVDLGTLVWGTALYPPTAPIAATATAGVAAAVVNWQPAAANGGSAITGYTVTSDPDAKTCTTTGATRCTVDGLTVGTAYTFTVRATNGIGDGPASAPTTPVTPTASARWNQLTPPAYDAPSGRALPAIASLGDGRTVLYGGATGSTTAIGQTWIWNGDIWTEIHPSTSPGPLMGAAMAPLGDGRAVLFGGTVDPTQSPSGTTWIFDGTNWTLQYPTTAPSPRTSAAMTTLSDGDVLLFGGMGADFEPLDDTWIFDGTTWTELDPGTVPPARTAPAIAALPNGEAVLFGGLVDSSTVLADTWIFDGATWHEVEASTAPTARAGAGMAALQDGRVVLFGGTPAFGSPSPISDETWVFDGADWTELDPSSVPPARYGAAMTATADGDVLLFGGTDQTGGSDPDDTTAPNDTWVFDGTDWSRHGDTAALPPTMFGSSAALPGGEVLLFGGADSPSYDTVYDTTWLFDGTTWKGLHPATSPPPRAGASMVTLSDGSVLLYGGFSPDHGAFDDTWIFDGTDWTEQSPATSPPALTFGSMVATPDGGAVYFGGADLVGSQASDATWVWDGSTWTEQTPTASPPSRLGATMAVGPDGDPVLFGGFSLGTGTLFDDTWVWDGTNWHEASPSSAPPARELASMVTLADGSILLFGGSDANNTTTFGDTWLFDGTSWTQGPSTDVPPPRAAASMVTRSDGTVLLIGGFTSPGDTALTDTWILQ